mgnify:CR=1 FL=1
MTEPTDALDLRARADATALRRLPRAALVIGLLDTIRTTALPLVLGGAARLRDGVSLTDAALAGTAMLVLGAIAWIRWRSMRWGLLDGRLVVHRGVVEKSRREIPLVRIVGVQVEEPLSWRLLGLARLRVQTASGAGDDATIDAVPRADVATLVGTLTAHAPHTGDVLVDAVVDREADAHAGPVVADALDARLGTASAARSIVLHRASVADLALAGLTGGALAGIGAILALFGRILDDLGLDRRVVEWIGERGTPFVDTIGRDAMLLVVTAVALGLLLISLPLAALLSIVRNGDLVVTRERGAIVRRAGLLNRTERRSPADAVQGIRLIASPVRRLVDGAALRIVTAAPTTDDDDDDEASGTLELVPLVRGEARVHLARALFPAAGALLQSPWRRIGVARVALLRAVITVVLAIAVIGAAWRLLPTRWAGVVWLALPPVIVACALHVDGRRRTAIAPDGDGTLIGVSWGSIVRTSAIVDAATTQCLVRSAGPLQRRAGLCSLSISLADGDDIDVPDVPLDEADALERRLRAATTRVLTGSARRPRTTS